MVFPVKSIESRATGAASVFPCCKTWIQECLENHPICRGTNTKLPRRVVKVGHITGEVRHLSSNGMNETFST
jgi:hypothetical protein